MRFNGHFTCFLRVLVVVAGLGSTLCAEPASQPDESPIKALISVPPEPRPNYKQQMTPEQRREESNRWKAEHQAWANSLTREQKTELKRRKEEEHRRLQEKSAKSQRLPIAADQYDWRTAARALSLSDSEIEGLASRKLVYGPSVKQSFQPYLAGPVFITTDSILNGFHVLFEDSFREAEERAAFQLRSSLETVFEQAKANLKKSPFPGVDTAPSMLHAQLVLGPALVLLGTSLDRFDAEVRGEIASQVAKIRAANTNELPRWLGPQSPTLITLDYRRLKPVGFYASDQQLADYFRAVRWLQMVPFRADCPVELGAIAMLGYGLNQAFDTAASNFFRGYDDLIGPRDGQDIESASHAFQNFFSRREQTDTWSAHLLKTRHWLLWRFIDLDDFPELTIDDRLPPDVENRLPEIQYRLMAGHRLPDSVLLQEIARRQLAPGGLAVAAMLGSGFARENLRGLTVADLEAAMTALSVSGANQRRGGERSLYDDYLEVLRSTQLSLPAESPDLFRSKEWKAKSCQTLLASWAQMRHAFTLQAPQSAMYLGLIIAPPGFVEPNPEFFSRFAGMVEAASRRFEDRGCFSPSPQLEAGQLRSDAMFIEAFKGEGASEAEMERYEDLVGSTERTVPAIPGWHRSQPGRGASNAEWASFRRDLASALRTAAERYDRGELTPPDHYSATRKRWETLERLARRLEALAHKQLRRQPWTGSEDAFLKKYGEELAFVMGYYGNSWLSPADDAPRWTEIHRDPAANRILAVGIGRPRTIYVLYPWDGMDILCKGSVLPYYEYTTSERLTDREWLDLVTSEGAPPLPAWMQPYMEPKGLASKAHD